MNPYQMAMQIRHLLRAATWPGGETVFSEQSVRIFAGTPNEEQIPPNFPWCLISIDGGEPDEDHPDIILQRFSLTTAALVQGDRMGEHALVGGGSSDMGKSANRGLLEVATAVRATVEALTGADGARVTLSSISTGTPAPFRGKHVVMDSLDLQAVCTSALDYAAPQQLQHAGGAWTWAGGHCSSRWDFVQYRLVRKTGTSASTDPDDGTTVYAGTTAAFTGAAASGSTYTVFADYASRGAVVDGSSSPEVGSYRVVT